MPERHGEREIERAHDHRTEGDNTELTTSDHDSAERTAMRNRAARSPRMPRRAYALQPRRLRSALTQEPAKKSTMTAIADAIWFVAALGAINWGLVGLFNYNIVDRLFADRPTRFLYVIIGVAGVAALFLLPLLRVKGTTGRTLAETRR